MKILFLSRWYPFPPDNGSKQRIYHLLRSLSSKHTVDLISFADADPGEIAFPDNGGFCRKVNLVKYRPFQPNRLQAVAGYFSMKPRSLVDTYQPELERLARTAVLQESYGVVIASQVDMSLYATRLPVSIRLLEELEITALFDRFKKQGHPLKRLRAWLTLIKLREYLSVMMKCFDGISVVSQFERQNLATALGLSDKVSVIPNGVDKAFLEGDFGQPQPNTIIYNGSLTYSANYDAIHYFLGQIFPRIQALHPEVRLIITGSTKDVNLKQLPAGKGVEFTGYLGDVRPYVAQSWLCATPLRLGGGTRLKIMEAMALGTPVVSTSKGAEGMDVHPGEDILIADHPEDFALQVIRLLEDNDLRSRLSTAGKKVMNTCCDWTIVGEQFNKWIESFVKTTPQP